MFSDLVLLIVSRVSMGLPSPNGTTPILICKLIYSEYAFAVFRIELVLGGTS